MHYKEVLKPDWLYGEAFKGKDVDLTIKSCEPQDLHSRDDQPTTCVVATFHETPKKLVLNTTNCETIAGLVESGEMESWVGKTFTFYPLKGKWFGKKQEAIRVRPQLPPQKLEKKETKS